MEFLLELLLEFVIQIVGEALFELGLHSMSEPFRKPPNPRLAAVGYALFGAILGGISLWLFPRHMVASVTWRWINLLVTPTLAGLCMSWIGTWRAKQGQAVLRIDRFSYGFLFAFSLALVRFFGAR
ncbi:hypothetical protein SAMN05660284_00746 [Formivibrio citricus]|uniref:Uncharacterized protein n=1 Tax=Formivibrio citricus TaxID=83765 RepID=A0A1I4WVG7_9NEIS|nr:hypothetical protein [Formivibrio citricus]SFN17457.1 hypothetical protein SAMN05660284_00746 [Formivibrio citricus]